MACNNCVYPVCGCMIYSQSVTFASGVLTVNIPAGSYQDGEYYRLVICQKRPDEATVNAPVIITIGTGTVQYPLLRANGAQMTAAALWPRTVYPVQCVTSSSGGAFRLRGCAPRVPNNSLASIDGTTPTT